MKNLEYYKDLIFELTKKELKIRYKNSVLGYFWSVASPLAQALVYYFAFKFVMRIKMDNYALFLIIGLFPWQCFSNSLSISVYIFLTNASLIKKTIFPREFLVISSLLNDTIHFILTLPVIILFLILYKQKIYLIAFILFPFILCLQFFITYGISLISASINLFFRDLERLVLIFLNILFFVTPIIYPASMIPSSYKFIVYLNPVALLVITYRSLFLKGTCDLYIILLLCLYSVIFLSLGYFVFNKLKWRFAEIL